MESILADFNMHRLRINYYGVAIDPAVDGKRSRVGLGFGVGLGVLLG